MLGIIFIGGLLLGAFIAVILLSLLIAGKKQEVIFCICPACKEKICFMSGEICTGYNAAVTT
jgi:hypothetical protein